MDILKFAHGEVTLRYVQKGECPLWLIHTGTHGDESGVIDSVRKYLEVNWNKMPDFLWVIEVSPSAVELETRKNKYGHDLNRCFRDGADDPEFSANLALLSGRQFADFISVHEDPDHFNTFYCYDSYDAQNDSRLWDFFNKIFARGIHGFTGVDDPNDPVLRNDIKNGYRFLEQEIEDGTTFDYFYRIGCVRGRRLNPEVPGLASQETKDFVVKAFFDYLSGCQE